MTAAGPRSSGDARLGPVDAVAIVDFRAEQVDVRHPGSTRDAPSALAGLSLTIRHGEQVAIVGASGAGKSTLLATLAMAREPAAGRLDVFGVSPWTLSPTARHRQRRRLFLAPQLPPLPPRQRVVDAVLAGRLPRWTLATALASLLRPADAAAARDALARFAVDDKLFHRVDRLSGGERQRVALARLVVADVDAYLVDEPLSALDPALAERAIAALQDVARERGATLVCSLHQVDVALARFPRIVGLRHGRVAFDLPAAAVDRTMLEAVYAEASAIDQAEATPGSCDAPSPAIADGANARAERDASSRIADGARL